jgi:hypothetical protein
MWDEREDDLPKRHEANVSGTSNSLGLPALPFAFGRERERLHRVSRRTCAFTEMDEG